MTRKNLTYFIANGESSTLNSRARESLRGSFVQLSDGATHYELAGPANGELVLLVPGMTIPLFYWDRFAKCMHEQGFRTLAYSAYGRGYSDRAQAAYDEGLFTRQLTELVSKLEVPEVSHIVATSMGALITMALPEGQFKPKTLTLVGPAGLANGTPLAARLAKAPIVAEVFGRNLARRSILSHVSQNVKSASDAEYLKAMILDALDYEGTMYSLLSTLRNFPLVARQALFRKAEQLKIPILLGWGDEDRITPISQFKEAQELLKPVKSFVLPCGHMAPLERPKALCEIVVDFINGVGPLRRSD
ncbi:alpha/beta hydrolase [Pseudomonas sp. MAFF 301449]|uniref:Alpha/beta hydrolase n=1 Tax=Pseudomonas cyclaminis TaxID=2781239 RepID=A0ABR9SRK2_9PSED|nr:alpha/beta hydrolase [Pseudomonas cyclaminis]MBE8591553.1 alpha/beta hydrolase [Pseudomonas cyclaminis]MBE8598643.1 alpha/beta hydrolase [Pseudomonas cyclaminis]